MVEIIDVGGRKLVSMDAYRRAEAYISALRTMDRAFDPYLTGQRHVTVDAILNALYDSTIDFAQKLGAEIVAVDPRREEPMFWCDDKVPGDVSGRVERAAEAYFARDALSRKELKTARLIANGANYFVISVPIEVGGEHFGEIMLGGANLSADDVRYVEDFESQLDTRLFAAYRLLGSDVAALLPERRRDRELTVEFGADIKDAIIRATDNLTENAVRACRNIGSDAINTELLGIGMQLSPRDVAQLIGSNKTMAQLYTGAFTSRLLLGDPLYFAVDGKSVKIGNGGDSLTLKNDDLDRLVRNYFEHVRHAAEALPLALADTDKFVAEYRRRGRMLFNPLTSLASDALGKTGVDDEHPVRLLLREMNDHPAPSGIPMPREIVLASEFGETHAALAIAEYLASTHKALSKKGQKDNEGEAKKLRVNVEKLARTVGRYPVQQIVYATGQTTLHEVTKPGHLGNRIVKGLDAWQLVLGKPEDYLKEKMEQR